MEKSAVLTLPYRGHGVIPIQGQPSASHIAFRAWAGYNFTQEVVILQGSDLSFKKTVIGRRKKYCSSVYTDHTMQTAFICHGSRFDGRYNKKVSEFQSSGESVRYIRFPRGTENRQMLISSGDTVCTYGYNTHLYELDWANYQLKNPKTIPVSGGYRPPFGSEPQSPSILPLHERTKLVATSHTNSLFLIDFRTPDSDPCNIIKGIIVSGYNSAVQAASRAYIREFGGTINKLEHGVLSRTSISFVAKTGDHLFAFSNVSPIVAVVNIGNFRGTSSFATLIYDVKREKRIGHLSDLQWKEQVPLFVDGFPHFVGTEHFGSRMSIVM